MKTFVISIEPNNYYPTIESMYQIYLGVHNTSYLIAKESSHIKAYKVKRVIKVICLFYFNT